MLRKLVLLLSLASLSCAKTFLPNTQVEDTGENRKILQFCEKYRHAVERGDTAELLKLAHPAYFEDAGNTDPQDDYDYNGLAEYLSKVFPKTTGIRYEIKYRRVTMSQTHHIWVDFTYAASFRIPGPKGEVWQHKVADNRLDLVRDGDSFRIMSGM